MLMGEPDILVHIKSHDILKAQLSRLNFFDKLRIDAQRRRACRQPQHEWALLLVGQNAVGDVVSRPAAHFFIIFLNNNSHVLVLLISYVFVKPSSFSSLVRNYALF